jgi:hypothetical protein
VTITFERTTKNKVSIYPENMFGIKVESVPVKKVEYSTVLSIIENVEYDSDYKTPKYKTNEIICEIAECLPSTEEFIEDSIKLYKELYGTEPIYHVACSMYMQKLPQMKTKSHKEFYAVY